MRAANAALGLCAGLPLTSKPAMAGQRQRDVPWLAEVLESAPAPAGAHPPLAPVLVDGTGRAITTLNEWRRRRVALQQTWRELLGPLAVERGRPPRVEVLEVEAVGDVVRQRVRYLVEPAVPTEAYLLLPRRVRRRCPGVIVFHSTTPESIRQPAGLADAPEKHFGLALARRGFVALCPRNFLWAGNTQMALQEQTRRFRERHPRARGMAKMLFDGQVALDVLAERPEVDAARLGCIGHSLGAKEALYLAAFDERIVATVSSEGGIGTTMSNWDAPWYLGDMVRQPGFAREHHELLALVAPRPFLLVGGESADGAAGAPWLAAALPAYRLYGMPARLGLLNHRRGHQVPPDALPRLLEWIETYV